MPSIKQLEADIQEIIERNSRVEADKSWETCMTRRLLLAAFTYLAIGFYLQAIEVKF